MPSAARKILGIIASVVFTVTTASGDDLTITSFLSYSGQTNIVLQATRNVFFTGGNLQLPALPPGASFGVVAIQAGNDVLISSGTSISAGAGWSVTCLAGANFNLPGTVVSGSGNLTLQGSGTLATVDGSISVLAGNAVTVGTGSITTTGGGGISVNAVSGSVNTGTRPNGFVFRNNSGNPYGVDPNPGGISTAAGGDVRITAGLDIVSFLPTGISSGDGGSGAFGAQPGNVTLTAGHNLTGHYVLRNGAGTMNAGQNAGLASRQVALSLVSGGWNVTAGQDIVLQEVRNPNGVFNNIGSASSPSYHLFDYAPGSYVSLAAGNSVLLSGQALPRVAGVAIGLVYAPSLNISAGGGGVQLGGGLILFPSADGQLVLVTTNGGALSSLPGNPVPLVMSDSAAARYTTAGTFGQTDHAPTPVHLGDYVPVQLNISGDLDSVMLVSPKLARINVGGNLNNAGLSAQNLNPADVTSLAVGGDILNNPQSPSGGFVVGGPGAFDISARNLDLGRSSGIQSVGPLNNPALAPLAASGADITLNLSGNLGMVSNTISSIAGGDIRVYVQGEIDLAPTNPPAANNQTHGIFTSARADVTVIAGGNINLSGSRIAAYDGGNIYIASISNNVDASLPGADSMSVTKVFGNPVQTSQFSFPGGGILAVTFPDSAEPVGNITVRAAQNILLGCGAITQVPLNGTSGSAAAVTLLAGGDVAAAGNCSAIVAAGTVTISSGGAGPLLSVQVNVTNLTTAAGTDVEFDAAADGLAPFGFQWLKDGSVILGATNATLFLSNVQRSDAGAYSIVVTNVAGTAIRDIQLRVLIPQQLSATLGQAGAALIVSLSPADGGPVTAADIAGLALQSSTNLIDWTQVSVPISTNAGGGLYFQLQPSGDPGRGFYRILSR